eukprot:CAMPEP_0115187290 /NCGR_PEP_ID=MMETSP0270-20121206/10419_1 /TAXON_ID=71861 /ORGANISM="Scrippsiella trochoidea, Strain CCMP3099" /LENGTH=821 /DNA_ID=CAMNT_0002600437 /DNA_START=121 /DNA_END=2586 /DNA_ORIENTATION=+
MELKDLFRLGQVGAAAPHPPHNSGGAGGGGLNITVSQPTPVGSGGLAGHHIKAWKFDSHGRAIVDSPVEFCDENGLLNADLQRNSSYLILHVRPTAATSDSEAAKEGMADAALSDLAASAGAACTPRGLAVEVASHCESQGPAESNGIEGIVSAAIRYAVFVWNGLDVDPLVKAYTMGKALELDRHLRYGLLRQPRFIDRLQSGIAVKGMASRREDSQVIDKYRTQPTRHDRNRLLNLISESTQRAPQRPLNTGSLALSNPRASGGHRFPRLGLSVCQSLTGAMPASKMKLNDQRWATTPTSAPTVPTSATPPSNLPTTSPALGCAGSKQVGKGIVIPRLALGALKEGSPRDALRAPPASEPMEVEGSSAVPCSDEGYGHKRFRGPDAAAPTPLTSRCAPPMTSVGASVATEMGGVPMTARLELGMGQQPRQAGQAPQLAIPGLSLGALGPQQRQPKSDAPGMLHLEELQMSEEELMNSYDPHNEENNYHLPHHLYKQLKLNHFRQLCSEIVPGKLFISSFVVAGDLEKLKAQGITHIVNTAGDICESRFPEHFQYLTYYLKDTNNEEISLLFYKTLSWIQSAIESGGRVLVHCREGVSRSATMIIAYLMWRFNLSFDAAHERIRKARPICNPNTGFTCQLLMLGKKLGASGCKAHLAEPAEKPGPAETPALFRVAPYHPREPFLLLVPADPARPLLDPRFGWVVQQGSSLQLWLGSQVPDDKAVREAVSQHVGWLETFEQRVCTLTVAEEGQEPAEFWRALGVASGTVPPTERGSLVAPQPALDADYELLRSVGARAAVVDTSPHMTGESGTAGDCSAQV